MIITSVNTQKKLICFESIVKNDGKFCFDKIPFIKKD